MRISAKCNIKYHKFCLIHLIFKVLTVRPYLHVGPMIEKKNIFIKRTYKSFLNISCTLINNIDIQKIHTFKENVCRSVYHYYRIL